MSRKPPGVKARGLGAELRTVRKALNLSMVDVANRLGWSESTVSRLETGQRNIPSEDVAALLAIYGVTGPERDRLLGMARTPDEPGWLEKNNLAGLLPADSVTLATYEAEANTLTNWSPLLVPGLMQTMDYTRAFMLADGIPEASVGARLMARQRRQQVLDHVEYTAYIDEPVLHRRIGGTRIMLGQLRHLVHMSQQSNVTIRVVPVGSDAHSGLSGPFLMLGFPSVGNVVHVELARSGVFLDDVADTDPYVQTLSRLSSLSLDAEQSRRRINDVATELEGHN